MSVTTSEPTMLVTGSGRNVGAALANAFLDDGLPVVAHYRSRTGDIDALERRGATVIQGDFSHTAGIFGFIEKLEQQMPALRGIIHNASGFTPTAADTAAAATQFDLFYAVHMLAPYLITRSMAPRLSGDSDQPADVIMITDIYSDNPSSRHDIYCATKAGLQNLALSFAKSLAPRTKVNVIQPGPIHFPSSYDDKASQAVLASTPMQRAGGAGAIVTAVRGILANNFMTGAVIPVDGGRRLGTEQPE